MSPESDYYNMNTGTLLYAQGVIRALTPYSKEGVGSLCILQIIIRSKAKCAWSNG